MNPQRHPTRRNLLAIAAATAAAGALPLVPGLARASSEAAGRPVRLLVGSPPGGPVDFMARLFGDAAVTSLGKTAVVENRPGASGTTAADAAAKLPPDGSGLFISGPGAITTAPVMYSKLGYDPQKDFVPVVMLGAGAFVLAVHPSVPARNVQELIALAKSKPGTLNYGSGGLGSSGHLCAESFSQATGIRMSHVPYKGDGQAVNDLLGGQIQLIFTAPNVGVPHGKAGRLRILAVTTRERVPSMPDIPTVAESGVKDFEYLGWVVAFAPAATPRPAIDALAAAWEKNRKQPKVADKLNELAMSPPDRLVTGEALNRFVQAEQQRLSGLARQLNLKAD